MFGAMTARTTKGNMKNGTESKKETTPKTPKAKTKSQPAAKPAKAAAAKPAKAANLTFADFAGEDRYP